MIREEPIGERVTAPELAFTRPHGRFAKPGLRLRRVIVLAPVVLLWLSPRLALADPTGTIAAPDKPVPNVETLGLPASSSDAVGPSAPAPGAPSQSGTAPSATLDPDVSITEQLQTLADGKFDRIITSTKERESIDAFYASRNYAPIWISEGKANARANAAIT